MDGRAVMVNLRGQYAGFVSRLIAFGIDNLFISVTIFLIGWIIRSTAEMMQFGAVLNLNSSITNSLRDMYSFLTRAPLLILYSSIFVLLYHAIFLVLAGSTPGKALLGLRVVGLDGKPVNFSRAFLRIMGYIPSSLPLFAGFLWIVIDNRRQAWHDKFARTCVIYVWDARPDERFLAIPIRRMNLLPNIDTDEAKNQRD